MKVKVLSKNQLTPISLLYAPRWPKKRCVLSPKVVSTKTVNVAKKHAIDWLPKYRRLSNGKK